MTDLSFPVNTVVHIGGVSHFSYRIQPLTTNAAKNVQQVFLINTETDTHLKCGQQRFVKNNGGRGVWSRWLVEPFSDGVSLQNVGHLEEKGDAVYLGSSNGVFVAVDTPEALSIELICQEEQDDEEETCEISQAAVPTVELTNDLRKTFIDTGVLHLPGLVQPDLVDNALVSINEALGMAWEGEDPDLDYLGTSRKSPAVLDLVYKSPIFGIVKQLLGKPKRPDGGQIAMRFPNNRNPGEEAWHIDGSNTSHMTPFQVLVGIALSPQPNDTCGNLVVFPGRHEEVHEAVRQVRQARQEAMDANEIDSISPWMNCRPTYGSNESVHMQLQPGDVVLAHQKIPHRVAHNTNPNIRYMVYFRFSHKRHRPDGPLGGLWEYFDGLQDLSNNDESCSAMNE